MSGMRFVDVWINCPERATAREIAEHCVGRRLAACANILGEIESVYRWKGEIERATEVTLVLKTRAELFDEVCAAVRALHPYELPSIIATELVLVDQAYADWLAEETADPA